MKNTIIEYLETNKPITLTNNNINKLALNIEINILVFPVPLSPIISCLYNNNVKST